MPPPTSVKLFLKGHQDCFLHATTSWLNYNYTPDKDAKLAIVRVLLPCGRSFLASLCPEAIPFRVPQKGVSQKKYFEIDGNFAAELGIVTDGVEVGIESVNGVEACSHLVIAPKKLGDLLVLHENLNKLETELAERIRIVSGQQSFSFPVWINNIAVGIRVERTEPSATWVLIIPGTTKLEITTHPPLPGLEDGPLPLSQVSSLTSYDYGDDDVDGYLVQRSSTNPPKSRLSSANSTDSSVDSEACNHSQQLNQSLPAMAFTKIASYLPFLQARTSPSPYEESGRLSGRPSSNEGFSFPPSATDKKRLVLDELQRKVPRTVHGTDMSRESDVAPSKSNSSGMRRSTSNLGLPKASHERSHTWGSPSEFAMATGNEKRPTPAPSVPRSVNTPGLSARLRVQPLVTTSENEAILSSSSAWVPQRAFDVFVNPTSLPEVFLSLEDKQEAILVELVPIESPSKLPQIRAADEPVRTSVESEIGDMGRATPALERQGGSGIEHKGLPTSLVVRLVFASRVVSGKGGMKAVIGGRQAVTSRDDTVEIPVESGHILLSDLVRQQLGIASCSSVVVNQVKDEWRIAYKQAPSLHLHPLDPPTQKSEEKLREEILREFYALVDDMFSIDAIGTPLVNKQVVQLQLKQGEWINCVLRVSPYKRSILTTPFLLVCPSDLKGRVNVYVSLSGSGTSETSARRSYQRRTPPSSTYDVKLPDIAELNLPMISENEGMFGGFDKLLEEGELFLKTIFSNPRGSGCLLITGTTGPDGTGCGTTTLAKLLCKRAMGRPYCAHVSTIECTTFRGQSSTRVKRRLRYLFSQAIQHHPSVILLDDIEHAMPQVSDPQEMLTEEGTASIKKSLIFLNLLQEVRSVSAQVVVIATVWYKNHLNQYLLQSRGLHVFDKTLELHPPTLAERKDILNVLLRRIYDEDKVEPSIVREVAQRTEGYQPGDLETLVERAISHCELRTLNPLRSLSVEGELPPDSPRRKVHSNVPVATSDVDSNGVDIPKRRNSNSSSYHTPGTSPSTPRSLRMTPGEQGVVSFSRTDSSRTVICVSPKIAHSLSLSNMKLILADFCAALEGFVPVSLRGLPLHSAGSVDFSHVGGLQEVKEALTETLLWPSKYPRLFSQCPIRQQCGVLLYGAPGTGKTMLARAVAKEFGLNFISIKGPELLNKYIGASEEAVRNLFSRAQSAKPCILFFDEFESLAPKRGHDDTGVTDRVVNQFLTQLDGVEVLSGVYVLAASSRPDLIDPALLRPGRIDKKIECLIPNEEARLDILCVLSRRVSMSGVNLKELASQTEGFTGADLKALLYSAQLAAAHEALDRKKREKESELLESIGSLSDMSPSAAVMGGDSDLSDEERWSINRTSSSATYFTFQSTEAGVTECEDRSHDLAPKVAMLKQKLSERRRPRSATLTSLSLKRTNTPDTKSHRHSKVSITMEHWRSALRQVRPSVSEKEKAKYQRIYDVFTGKSKPEPVRPKVTMS